MISTVGYISPTGMYLSLTQSDADEDKLVGSIHPSCRRPEPSTSTAPGGSSTKVTEREPVWTTRLDGPTGPAQIAVTGAGTDEYRTLAAATQSQPPLPVR